MTIEKKVLDTNNLSCEDCDSVIIVKIEPYGAGKMAVISCPNCGVSYDTNLDESESN